VAVADVDQDGDVDLLIGVPGQALVFIAFREGPADAPRFEVQAALGPSGVVDVGWHPLSDTKFGAQLFVGELDGDPEVELLVGAERRGDGQGAAFLYGVGAPLLGPPIEISPPVPGEFGRALAMGDLDADGATDLVIAAPQAEVDGVTAGRVWIYPGPIDGVPEVGIELRNPWPVENGAFGHQLAIDGAQDAAQPALYISSPGNTNDAGFEGAGQVLRYTVPVESEMFLVAQEAQGSTGDPPRFGMHIAVRRGYLLVGAPRKDVGAALDAGLGFVFDAGLGAMTGHRSPVPMPEDLFGYRVGAGDLVGDEATDFVFAALWSRSLLLWDGSDRNGLPCELRPPEGTGDHFVMGFEVTDVLEGPRDELVMGDSTWDRPGESEHDDVGRVVVQRVVE